MKEGNLDLQLKQTTSNESLNELKNMLNDMIQTINVNVNEDINIILSSLEKYSKLNFVDSIANPTGNVAKGLNNLSNIINQMLQQNKENGLILDDSSKILLKNVNLLNKSSNETAVSLEETAAALEEITSTVANNTERISTMANHSKELSNSIEGGQKLANVTVESMDSINNSVQHLSNTIDDFRNFFIPNKERKSFDVKDSFTKVFKLTEAQFVNKNISILNEIESIELFGLENELIQVLINILLNFRT